MLQTIEKANTGDEIAFNQILSKHKPMLNRICRQYFLVGADFDDLMQEAMIGLITAIKTYNYDKNDNFKNYAYLIINRRLLSIIRSGASDKWYMLNNARGIDAEGALIKNDNSSSSIVATTGESFEDDFTHKEQMIAINEKLKLLLDDRDFYILSDYLLGYKYAEIGARRNISSKLVDNRLQSIKRQIVKNQQKIFN